MIEKMTYISIVAHNDYINEVLDYILAWDIHLKGNAGTNEHHLFLQILKQYAQNIPSKLIDESDAIAIANKLAQPLNMDTTELKQTIAVLENYIYIDISVADLLQFDYLKFTVGKMPLASFSQLQTNIDNRNIVIIEGNRNTTIHIIYFCLQKQKNVIDNLFKDYNFKEEDFISFVQDNCSLEIKQQSLKNIHAYLQKQLIELEEENKAERLIKANITEEGVTVAYNTLLYHTKRRNIVEHTIEKTDNFFVFSGFMPENQAFLLDKELKNNKNIILQIEPVSEADKTIPTKLKNNPLFEPFEIFVKAYSLPHYNEIDPTPILAVVYTILFGVMFGDVGQGLVICFIGYFLKKPIKNIVITVGLSSTFFGFLYGSIFGFEHIIDPLWLVPAHHINLLLLASIAIGIALVSLGILISIINNLQKRKFYNAVLGPNSVTGLLFYIGGVVLSIRIFTSAFTWQFDMINFIFSLMLLPLILFFIFEVIRKPSNIIEVIIEAFENLLSYATNTLSFIRVGAIILSHSAMMGAVFLISSNLSLGGSILAVGIGNVIVMGIEILVVGIQALRLHYYEIFSRFYQGGGISFTPVRDKT